MGTEIYRYNVTKIKTYELHNDRKFRRVIRETLDLLKQEINLLIQFGAEEK